MIGEPEFQVNAKLAADGTVSCKVMAFVKYGERSVTTDVLIEDKKMLSQLGTVLDRMKQTVAEKLGKDATGNAIRCASVAIDLKEDI